MTKEAVKSKIKKLLALAGNNPSDEESYSALQKAQALMVQYKIEEREIDEKEKECISYRTRFSYGPNSSDTYLNELAQIIADNFCCMNYVSRLSGEKTRYISFIGYEEDIDVAVEAMTLANLAIIKGYNRVWKSMCQKYNLSYIPAKYFNPAKLGYIDGYLRGLKEVFDSQREQNQEWGLVLVAPKEAQDYISSLRSDTLKSQLVNNTYYDEGYKDGKQFNMHKRVDSQERSS